MRCDFHANTARDAVVCITLPMCANFSHCVRSWPQPVSRGNHVLLQCAVLKIKRNKKLRKHRRTQQPRPRNLCSRWWTAESASPPRTSTGSYAAFAHFGSQGRGWGRAEKQAGRLSSPQEGRARCRRALLGRREASLRVATKRSARIANLADKISSFLVGNTNTRQKAKEKCKRLRCHGRDKHTAQQESRGAPRGTSTTAGNCLVC